MKTLKDYKRELESLLLNEEDFKTKQERRMWKIQVDALRSHIRMIS